MKKSEHLKKKRGKFSPRVGEEYQADIPLYIGKHDYHLQLRSRPGYSDHDPIISPPNSSSPQPTDQLMSANREDGNLTAESSGQTWTDLEQDSFLLGLYIFEKDFVLLKRFIGTNKEVGDIHKFYFGKFYNSEGHVGWCEHMKLKDKRKRIAIGEKIFTRWRRDKFLTQLISLVSEDLRDALTQVFFNFNFVRNHQITKR